MCDSKKTDYDEQMSLRIRKKLISMQEHEDSKPKVIVVSAGADPSHFVSTTLLKNLSLDASRLSKQLEKLGKVMRETDWSGLKITSEYRDEAFNSKLRDHCYDIEHDDHVDAYRRLLMGDFGKMLEFPSPLDNLVVEPEDDGLSQAERVIKAKKNKKPIFTSTHGKKKGKGRKSWQS
jgi:hypothetical protein